MPTLDPRVTAYVEGAPDFARPILERIRAAFHEGCPDVVETIKWSRPFFEHHGPLGGMAAFKAHVGWGFWRAAELEDPAGILGLSPGASPMQFKARAVDDLPAHEVLVDYVRRAAALNASGRGRRRPRKPPAPVEAPAWLLEALQSHPEAWSRWQAFPPSHRREYVRWLTEAKRPSTRERRLAQALAWIAEGKDRNWKYRRS